MDERRKKALRERNRCEVGLHNYVFPKHATSKDQEKEYLICKRCYWILRPTSLEPRIQHTSDVNQEPERKEKIPHISRNGTINFDKEW